jgi:hypothetical protein
MRCRSDRPRLSSRVARAEAGRCRVDAGAGAGDGTRRQDHETLRQADGDPEQGRRAARSEPAHAGRRGAFRDARAARRPLRGVWEDPRRDGLLLGRRAAVLESAWRRIRRPSAMPGLHAEPKLRGGLLRPHRTHGGRQRDLRSGGDDVRGDPEGVLGGARSDPGHAPGQRRRDPVSLRDLPDERGATRTRRAQQARLSGPSQRGRAWHDHDRDQGFASVFLRGGLPPAVPREEPGGYCGIGGTGVSAVRSASRRPPERSLGRTNERRRREER